MRSQVIEIKLVPRSTFHVSLNFFEQIKTKQQRVRSGVFSHNTRYTDRRHRNITAVGLSIGTVSYTHLTLPTIYSV